MGTFDGRVVIVTGGALGMGSTTATEFAKEGAAVVVADVNGHAGESIIASIQADGGKGLFVDGEQFVILEYRPLNPVRINQKHTR